MMVEEEAPRPIVAETPALSPIPAIDQPAGPVPISLRNGTAVRAAMPAGISAFLCFLWLSQIGPLANIAPILLLGGGTFAVYLYRRRTGQSLSILNGARLGWLAGLFPFLVVLLMFTAIIALNPGAIESGWDQFVQQGKLTKEQAQAMAQMIRGPEGVVYILVMTFLTSTIPAALGGAMGAKIFGRSSGA